MFALVSDRVTTHNASGCAHRNEEFLTEVAGAGHRIAVLVMARAYLVAVDSKLAGLTGHIAAGQQRRDKTHTGFTGSRAQR